MDKLKKYNEFLLEKARPFSDTSITVFDLDDTLVITQAKIKVCNIVTGDCHELTPEEFNEYESNPNDKLDFDDFKSLEIMKAGELIHYYLKILADAYKMKRAVGIVTARDDREMIYKWMKEHVGFHIAKDLIFAINDPVHKLKGSISEKKKEAFRQYIEMGYKNIQFFDDDDANLRLVKELETEYPDINLSVYKANKNIFKSIEKK
tara:strand:+ start:314 stop:931 length:618 start_codon:yes stop_codon:yes gene_type:complete